MTRYSPEGLEKMRVANEARFLRDARARFGDRFDYSRIQYLRQKVPVTIVCPDHGPFEQTPDKHLNSLAGCPKCGVIARSSSRVDGGRKLFLAEFDSRYGDRLELLSSYVRARDPIVCRCKIHDTKFKTTPDRLGTSRHACPMCAREATKRAGTMSQEDFLSRAADKFGAQFDLSCAHYSGMNAKVSIGCPIHGEFSSTPVNFLNSTHGCPKCGKLHVGTAENRIKRLEQGIIKPRPTIIAVMRVEVFGITGYKVGITSRTLLARYREALREILFEAKLDELDALKLERAIHAKYFRNRDVRIFLAGLRSRERWSGDSEIYAAEAIPTIIEELTGAIAEITKGAADYWQGKPELTAPILRIRTARKVAGVYNLARPVIRLDTLERFPSADYAAKAVGASPGNLSSVCLGKRGHVKGIRFAYVSEYEAGNIPQFQQRRTGKNNPRARAIICINTGKRFDTVTEASLATGVHSGKIVAVCKGKRGSANGLRFAYLTDHEAGTSPELIQHRQGKNNHKARAVRCIESGTAYDTLTEAAVATGAHVSAIVRACRNEGKTAGGFHWEYV
jgi:hypothetical protein